MSIGRWEGQLLLRSSNIIDAAFQVNQCFASIPRYSMSETALHVFATSVSMPFQSKLQQLKVLQDILSCALISVCHC